MKKEAKASNLRLSAHVLIVEAGFYEDLANELAKGAITAIEAAGSTWDRIQVPGALEIPGAIALAANAGNHDAYVALGTVIRGETTHYDIVANESSRAIMDLTLEGLAIGNGILTVENEDQAWARAKVDDMDKGGAAAIAALTMVSLQRALNQTAKGIH